VRRDEQGYWADAQRESEVAKPHFTPGN